jgi:hypothetical protein
VTWSVKLTGCIATKPCCCKRRRYVATEEKDAEARIFDVVSMRGYGDNKAYHGDGDSANDVETTFFARGRSQ